MGYEPSNELAGAKMVDAFLAALLLRRPAPSSSTEDMLALFAGAAGGFVFVLGFNA
jgi:hypothetical protein